MLHATCVPLHASCYPTPTLGNVCDEGAEVCVEVVGGGGWSLLLPVIARICERAHSRLMSTTGGLSPAFASLTSWAFFIALSAILSANSLPGTSMCDRT